MAVADDGPTTALAHRTLGWVLVRGSHGIGAVSRALGAEAPGRPLHADERALLRAVYHDGLDLERLRIVRTDGFNTLTLGEGPVPRVLGWNVYWPNRGDYGAMMPGDRIADTPVARGILVHEAAHVAQHQHAGCTYASRSVTVQLAAMLRGAGRGGAYDWVTPALAARPWTALNPEQQAMAIEDAYLGGVLDGAPLRRRGVDLTEWIRAALAQARAGRGWA